MKILKTHAKKLRRETREITVSFINQRDFGSKLRISALQYWNDTSDIQGLFFSLYVSTEAELFSIFKEFSKINIFRCFPIGFMYNMTA